MRAMVKDERFENCNLPWNDEDYIRLENSYAYFSQNTPNEIWENVSTYLKRTPKACMNAWYRMHRGEPYGERHDWTQEEIAILKHCIDNKESMKSISEKLMIPPYTIRRFARKINFIGFSETYPDVDSDSIDFIYAYAPLWHVSSEKWKRKFPTMTSIDIQKIKRTYAPNRSRKSHLDYEETLDLFGECVNGGSYGQITNRYNNTHEKKLCRTDVYKYLSNMDVSPKYDKSHFDDIDVYRQLSLLCTDILCTSEVGDTMLKVFAANIPGELYKLKDFARIYKIPVKDVMSFAFYNYQNFTSNIGMAFNLEEN